MKYGLKGFASVAVSSVDGQYVGQRLELSLFIDHEIYDVLSLALRLRMTCTLRSNGCYSTIDLTRLLGPYGSVFRGTVIDSCGVVL